MRRRRTYVRGKRLQKGLHTVVALSNSEGQTAGGTRERQQRRALETTVTPEGARRVGVTKKALSNSEGQTAGGTRERQQRRALATTVTPEGAGRVGVTKKAEKL